jgi:hypothetical protein
LDIRSSSVGSFQVLSCIRSGRVSNHLMSGYFRIRVVSGPVRFGMRLSSIGSFRVSDRIWSGRSGIGSSSVELFRISGRIISDRSDIESFSVELFRILNHIDSGRIEQIFSDWVGSNHL